jgi:MFS transporter, SP family, solute carrier family 2 (myo-inositol transporter), member 13
VRCKDGSALGWLAALSMVAYLACFGIGLSSVPWTVNAEIYPQRARSFGTAVSTSVNWAGNVLVSATFLTVASPTMLSQHGAFWLYGAVAIAGWLWVKAIMPETAGLTLEQVETLFMRPGDEHLLATTNSSNNNSTTVSSSSDRNSRGDNRGHIAFAPLRSTAGISSSSAAVSGSDNQDTDTITNRHSAVLL